MEGDLKVSINYDKLEADAKWDGLKGYLTNTDIPVEEVYAAYHNLWHVEKAFRIAKSKIEIRPMFHFTRKENRGACMHLLRRPESLQGTGEAAEAVGNQHER